MSNKLLALIILLSVFAILIGGYVYFFVFYGATIIFSGNISGYKVELSNASTKQKLTYLCEETVCSYEKVPPLDFEVRVSKEGYDDYKRNVKVPGKGELQLEFILEKTPELLSVASTEATQEEIIEKNKVRLQYKRYFKHYDFGEQGVFYIREYLGKLFLYRDKGEEKNLIYDFDLVSKNKIHIAPIYGTNRFIVHFDGTNYLFDNDTTSLSSLDLKVKISYAKKGNSETFLFVTDVGTYVYDIRTQKSEYYYLFSDFVHISDQEILGILRPEDENKRNNLGLDNTQKTQIYRYRGKKEQKLVYETEEAIDEIYIKGGKLFLKSGSRLSELKNY